MCGPCNNRPRRRKRELRNGVSGHGTEAMLSASRRDIGRDGFLAVHDPPTTRFTGEVYVTAKGSRCFGRKGNQVGAANNKEE